MPEIDLAQIFIGFIVLLFSLTVHEAAHAWTAYRLGDSTARLLGRVSLNPAVHADLVGTIIFPLMAMLTRVPLLGWAKPVPVVSGRLRRPRRDFMLVAAAGPISNLLLAVGASIALRLLVLVPVTADGPQIVQPLAAILIQTLVLNVTLAVFNMMPIPPLDGGNVLVGLLPRNLGVKFDNLIRPYGFLLLLGLIATDALAVLVFRPARFIVGLL